MQAAAQGQSLFVSSGDTGVFCAAIVGVNGVPAGIPSVEYPASSPYAVGVGGPTGLGPGPNEVGWYAGGGGGSHFQPPPAPWTAGPGPNEVGWYAGGGGVSYFESTPASWTAGRRPSAARARAPRPGRASGRACRAPAGRSGSRTRCSTRSRRRRRRSTTSPSAPTA